MKIISLFDCLEARYPIPPDEYIYCRKNHQLGNGKVHIRQLKRGDKLVFKTCQFCKDFVPFDDLYVKE